MSQDAEAEMGNLISRIDRLRSFMRDTITLGDSIVGQVPNAQDEVCRTDPCCTLGVLSCTLDDCIVIARVLDDQMRRIDKQLGGN